jgi:two-component system OmpR family sensor kinase
VSLRLRLTFLYLGFLAVALVAFGVVAYVIAAKNVYDNLDDSLSARVQTVDSSLETAAGPLSEQDIDSSRRELERETSGDVVFQIRGLDGRLLYSSQPASRELPLPKNVSTAGQTFTSRKVQGRRLRVLYQPVIRDGQTLGSVVAGQSLQETDEALDEIRKVFIFGGLAVLLLTTGPTYALARRALNPVRQVSQLARDIERTADFTRRLPTPRGGGEMKELVATFNAMIDRVEQALVAQRSFLADSSHELRRPLTVLRTDIDILNDPSLPAEEREACFEEMRAEAEAMSRLLSDLLLLSREEKQAIGEAPVDYSLLCEQAVARLRTQDAHHKTVAEVVPGVRVQGDRERLAQMLWNLLENAAQYTPDGGQIELHLRLVNGFARVEVQDTGIGIAENDMPHVFDRFYRGEGAQAVREDGVGLGLAIVKYVAEAHGGMARASSQPGCGTTLSVDIPLAAGASPN